MNTLFNLNDKLRGNLDKTKSSRIKNAVALSLSMHFLTTPAHALTDLNRLSSSSILNTDLKKQNIKSINRTTLPTKKYTVNIGENIQSIAKNFNIEVVHLQSLNANIDLSKSLKAGDIILVPLVPFTKNIPVANNLTLLNINDTQNKIAQMAAQIGSMLDTNPNSNAASAMTRNIATSAVNNSLEKWFSQYGRLRAQVSVDENFSLKNSQYDLLFPVWENKKNLVFTQASVHRTDDRNQANLGFGIRRFNDDYMIGGNTFIDYDMSNDHSRAGIGGEYWSNFLKISANGYLRLSNWKDSKKVEDYEERAANGWDIRTEGYLPAYPQLGGKLMYEKYYGNEVALFGKDKRQENPQALTLGLSYTPIPLITMNVEHKQGQDSNKDTSIGVEMNYQFGVPWAKQIDPKAVSALRSLAGNRYDFVERNNNIVLEYRKKELIFLNMVKQVRGFSGEQKSLEVSVQTKYGLDHIEWDAKEVITQGGEIIQNGKDYTLKLPDYKYSRIAPANTYSISAVAYDTQGNTSARQTARIEVTEAAVSNINSEFTPTTTTLVANGTNTQILKLTIKDYKGNPIHISPSEIELNVSSKTRGNIAAKVGEWKQVTNGEFEVTVTTGTQVEILTLTPTVRGTTLKPVQVEMIAGDIDQINSTLLASPKEIIANGKDETEITLNLEDEQNNAIKGKTVTFSIGNLENIQIGTVTEINGVYKAKLTGTKSGTATITAYVDGVALNLKDEVKLKAGVIDATTSVIKASPKVIYADGKTTSTLSLELFDIHQNPIDEGTVTFEAKGVAGTTLSKVEYKNGIYTANLSGEQVGNITITPSYNKTPLQLSSTVELKQPLKEITTDVNKEKVKVGENINLTITPIDYSGKPIPNVDVTLNFLSKDRQKQNRSDSGILQINGSNIQNGMTLKSDQNGQIKLTLTDPNGIGVEHLISVNSDNISTERSVYFTVLTSPDVSQAQMWGHMSNSKLVAANGTTFARPKVAGEASGYQGTYKENNETWPLFNANRTGMYNYCGDVPNTVSSTDYIHLFERYGTSIPSTYGWPTEKYYRSNTSSLGDAKWAYDIRTKNSFPMTTSELAYVVCK